MKKTPYEKKFMEKFCKKVFTFWMNRSIIRLYKYRPI